MALWLIDHQMNLVVGVEFGQYFVRIPLKATPHIVHGNALSTEWTDVLPAERCSFVLGNPPFVGAKFMSDEQRANAGAVFTAVAGGGLLDFVAAWYVKAAHYIATEPSPRCAFVSTNSICQGEQVGVLWGWLLAQGIKIHFAHRTFAWSNEARSNAAVHCVIVGFGRGDAGVAKTIYEYDDIRGEPNALAATNINPYLVDAPDVVLARRSRPIGDAPAIGIGNKPIDDGNFLFSTEERDAFVANEPASAKWLRRWIGADEFINGTVRWCLWLGEASPAELRAMPEAMKRVQAVKSFRLASRSAPTRALADTPTRFHVENIPRGDYLIFPRHSSETRRFLPVGFGSPLWLVGDACLVSDVATTYHFGILTSTMHNAWVRYTCGRLESRYRYSAAIVYNNFPWPEAPTEAHKAAIEAAAQTVLDTRAQFPGSTLADLYDPLAMPQSLLKAHQKLDAAVDAAYASKRSFKSDAERVAFLFEQYQRITSLLPAVAPAKRARRRVSA